MISGPDCNYRCGIRNARLETPCYKTQMVKATRKWLLFKYVDGELTPLSKPFNTKALAEKAREKYSERERKAIAVGLMRTR